MHALHRTLTLLFALAMLTLGSRAVADTSLTVAYLERPPFYFTKNGTAQGIIIDRTRQILVEAGLKYEFHPMSVSRIMSEIKTKGHRLCSLGWFKTPEREKIAIFSRPIYQMKPMTLLFRAEDQKIFDGLPTLRRVFSNPALVMGKAAGFSYGNYVDGLIKELHPTTADTDPLHENLLKMLDKKRVTYMLVPPEEVDTLLDGANLAHERFATKAMQDVNVSDLSHVMCNKSIGEVDMKKLDAAITKLVPTL